MRDDRERLLDILHALEIIDTYLSGSKLLHEVREIEFLGVVKCLETIGEAIRYLSDSLKNKYSEIPWRQIANMCNVLAHQYFKIDIEKVEKAVTEDLPKLKAQIESIISEFELHP